MGREAVRFLMTHRFPSPPFCLLCRFSPPPREDRILLYCLLHFALTCPLLLR